MPPKWYVCDINLKKKGLLNALSHAQLSTVKSLYAQHFIHCDIKLDNFMVQADTPPMGPTVFLIDFGLVQLFRNPATFLHSSYTMGHSIVSTIRFASVNGQQGYAQSHHDNLESLTYTIIYLACRSLPWAACRGHEAVLRKKKLIKAEELCDGLPAPFCKFVIHVHSLGFNKRLDYQHLQSILLQCSEAKINQASEVPPFSAPSPVDVNCTPVRDPT